MNWFGVMPAVTTPFDENLKVDHEFLGRHARWLIENGCTGLIMPGSLGEGATLEHDEKIAILKTAINAAEPTTAPVVAAISSLSTRNAVQLARDAEQTGCSGLMVLPPYVYTSDWREMKQHVAEVIRATKLPCMLYNNPIAYKTDFISGQIAELAAEHENLQAVKESSADVRRVMAIREAIGDRLKIFVGVDDLLVEAVDAGATGWVAGLVNAFPRESVELFELALAGKRNDAYALYEWFLPLLRMDTVPKFVQLIKWVQQQTGTGRASVRPPRLELAGTDLGDAKAVLKKALSARPSVRSTAFPAMQ
ncbi:MAG TPA: dihydrodipicolinate synthase family protein [Candidatus Aquilonibacter sp.]|nr:dihydrodipicolinate synthase family protein [Candidatus Aquilonibacter sp.]